MASAGRWLARGSPVMIISTLGFMNCPAFVGESGSIEAEKSIRAGHQVAHDTQAGKRGEVVERDVPPPGRVRTRVKNQAARLERLQLRVRETSDRLVDAVKVHGRACLQRGLGQAQSVTKVWLVWESREQEAKFS